MLPALLLLWAAGSALWFLKGDLGEYRRFRALADTRSRRRRYLLWTAKAWIAFGLPALAGLTVLGRGEALRVLPPEFAGLAGRLPHLSGGDVLAGGLVGGAVAGVVGGGLLAVLARRRGGRNVVLGDVGSLLPRETGELPHVVLLSLTAALVEEAFFRLLVPLLVALAGGGAAAGFVASSLLFGAMHLYQGRAGLLATGGFGALLAWLYLATGALWVAAVVHLAANLNGLVLRPFLAGDLRRRSAG